MTKALWRTAYHEAGHAVTAWTLDLGVKMVTIAPTEDTLGHVLVRRHMTSRLADQVRYDLTPGRRDLVERKVLVSLAGMEAERRHSGRRRLSGAGLYRLPPDQRDEYSAKAGGRVDFVCGEGDFLNAIDLLALLTSEGTAEFDAYLAWLSERTKTLLVARWGLVERVAAALVEHRTLDGDGFIDALELPPLA
jgi:hypothetical protein